MRYRENINALQLFYAKMIRKLEKNEFEKNDSWTRCDMKYLESALHEEIRKYNESGDIDELIDIAIMCMMVYNRKRGE